MKRATLVVALALLACSSRVESQAVTPRQVAVPVAAVFAVSVYAIHADKQWHHEYIGAALLASSSRRVQWVGVAIMADDALQHFVQIRKPEYRSPLHLAYRYTLYQWFFR